ncbi:MAG: peptidoglycan-associated lipoprotein Pal [Pseudomonadota bacterium]
MFALRGSAAALLLAAAVLGGCSSSVPLNEGGKAQIETRNPNQGQQSGSGAATSQSQVASVDLGANKAGAADSVARTVYFDFDSYVVKDEFRPVIEAHAKRLAGDRKKRLVIEGHTDERGGSEYNLALGQKRAEAVAKSMVTLGAAENQLEAVSFGKERPAVQGSDESAWAKNRRAELKDR